MSACSGAQEQSEDSASDSMGVDTEPRDTQKETANDIVSTSATEVPNDEPPP